MRAAFAPYQRWVGFAQMIEVLTLQERHLATELALGLARRLEFILGTSGGNHVGPGYVHHMYTSDFETGCNVLWRLGVAHAAYGPEPGRKGLTVQTIVNENIFPPYFKFFPPAEISGLFS